MRMESAEKGTLVLTTSQLFPEEPFAALIQGNRLRQIQFFSETKQRLLNQIYIGRVDKVVQNLSAAFVELEKGSMCYLPLEDLDRAIFTKKIGKKAICQDEELLVQVVKEAVKSKVPVATTKLSLNGQYVILLPGKKELHFSKKLPSEQRQRFHQWYENAKELLGEDGLLFRTEAQFAPDDRIEQELLVLKEKWAKILQYSQMRTCYSCLYKPDNGPLPILQHFYRHEYDQIVTDLPTAYQALQEGEVDCAVAFYQDPLLSLSKLYNIDKQLEDTKHRQLWMKSGASLYIEQTEALVSIDVNSGKNILGKNKEESILKINLEAVQEIAVQARLRRLSGILMIDFINMKEEAHNQQVMQALRHAFYSDPMSPVVVDMTKLGLVEATRSKKERPLAELWRNMQKKC